MVQFNLNAFQNINFGYVVLFYSSATFDRSVTGVKNYVMYEEACIGAWLAALKTCKIKSNF